MFDQTNQPMYGYGMQQPMGGGYNYQGMQQPTKVMNVLTTDEIKELQQQQSVFRLGLTEKESKQAVCNHRSIDGMSDSLSYDSVTGIARCTICGYEFNPIDPNTSYETIKEACDRVEDILQSSKLMYLDLPPEAAREYYQIIPLIAKIPQLFEFAAKNYSKHDNDPWSYNNHNMGGIAMLQNLNSMFGAPMAQPMQQPMGNGYPQQGMYGGMQQPMMGQQMGMPGYPQQPYNPNAFGYQGASQQPQYTPAANGFAYNPNQAVANPAAPTIAAPAAPTEPTNTTVTEQVNV